MARILGRFTFRKSKNAWTLRFLDWGDNAARQEYGNHSDTDPMETRVWDPVTIVLCGSDPVVTSRLVP